MPGAGMVFNWISRFKPCCTGKREEEFDRYRFEKTAILFRVHLSCIYLLCKVKHTWKCWRDGSEAFVFGIASLSRNSFRRRIHDRGGSIRSEMPKPTMTHANQDGKWAEYKLWPWGFSHGLAGMTKARESSHWAFATFNPCHVQTFCCQRRVAPLEGTMTI